MDSPRSRNAFRCAALTLGLIVLFGVPALYQVFHVRQKPIWHWKLYSGHGMHTCAVRYRDLTFGDPVDIDRAELLADESDRKYRRYVRTVHDRELVSQTSAVCTQLRRDHGRMPDVRLEAKCSQRKGWIGVADGEHNVCQREGAQVLRDQLASAKARARKAHWR